MFDSYIKIAVVVENNYTYLHISSYFHPMERVRSEDWMWEFLINRDRGYTCYLGYNVIINLLSFWLGM